MWNVQSTLICEMCRKCLNMQISLAYGGGNPNFWNMQTLKCRNILTWGSQLCVEVEIFSHIGILKWATKMKFFTPWYFYCPQMKFVKIMFLHLSVSHSVHRGFASVHAGIHTCPQSRHPPGSRHPLEQRADTPRADTPQEQTPAPRSRHPPGAAPWHSACWEIWATSGWYASYWNAYLSMLFCHLKEQCSPAH